jgi:hypothetical protein
MDDNSAPAALLPAAGVACGVPLAVRKLGTPPPQAHKF